MSQNDEGLNNERKWSASDFVAAYDREMKERKSFDKTHVRQTYLIRRDLSKRLNDLCKDRPGFKTKFINFAIEKCLEEINHSKQKPELSVVETPAARELTMAEVETLIAAELDNTTLNDVQKQQIRQVVLKDLFKPGSDKTALFNGTRYVSVETGRGKSFKDPEKCVISLIRYRTAMGQNVKSEEETPNPGADLGTVEETNSAKHVPQLGDAGIDEAE
jgi:hypothetical protein